MSQEGSGKTVQEILTFRLIVQKCLQKYRSVFNQPICGLY